MSKVLKVTLDYSLIIEAVKADTFISGQTEKAADGANNAKVFGEIAGDEELHKRKLDRTLRGALGALEAFMVDFVDPSATIGSSGSSISDTLSSTTKDTFDVSFAISDRFNAGLAFAIGQLMQEYIINKMLVLWWAAVVDRRNDVSQYLTLSNESLANIRRCLQKTAPSVATSSYDSVTGAVTDSAAATKSDPDATSNG